MIATKEQIVQALKKQPSQSRAQKMINKLMRLKELSQDYGSPLVVHLRAELEKLATQKGMEVLSRTGEEAEEARKYFQVFTKAWEIIDGVVVEYYNLNKQIIEQSRR